MREQLELAETHSQQKIAVTHKHISDMMHMRRACRRSTFGRYTFVCYAHTGQCTL